MRSLIGWLICLSLVGCGPDVAPPDRGLSSDVPLDVVAALEAGDSPPLNEVRRPLSTGDTASISAFVMSPAMEEELAIATKLQMQATCPEKIVASEAGAYTYLGTTTDGEVDGKLYIRLKTGGGSTMWVRSLASLSIHGTEVIGTDGKIRAHAVSIGGVVDHTVPVGLTDQLVSWSADPCK